MGWMSSFEIDAVYGAGLRKNLRGLNWAWWDRQAAMSNVVNLVRDILAHYRGTRLRQQIEINMTWSLLL